MKMIGWACWTCRKISWEDIPENDAAPEHVSYRGAEVGKCAGKMEPIYMMELPDEKRSLQPRDLEEIAAEAYRQANRPGQQEPEKV